jgi:ubiquinone/menaquinone biosynthesis C-methylase UbiE
MQGYLAANQNAYDAIATEFQDKKSLRLDNAKRVTGDFSRALKKTAGSKVLELGPGSGEVSRLLSEAGLKVTAIEFSPLMASLAAQTAPKAKLINAEFLSYDFGANHFDGIFGMAFIHLFPAEEAIKVMNKITDLVKPSGIVHLSTTKHQIGSEGFTTKDNFKNNVARYRVKYTPTNLKKLVTETGMKLIDYSEVFDAEASRTWMQVILQK